MRGYWGQVFDNVWFAAVGYLTFRSFGSGFWHPWAAAGACLGLCVGLLWGIWRTLREAT